jgi:hypothetical protein
MATKLTPERVKKAKDSPKRRALIAHIRFQLDQLTAQNAQHEFEHICRHFARERISRDLLPATGPVSAGGDGGRDFETFTTFIRGETSTTTVFRGFGESKPLAFACSITSKSRVKAKVRDDLEKICANTPPYIVYFFSNQSVPVPTRHELQKECEWKHSSRLELIDAEAMSEQLADPGLFWIAEEYLHVPSDLFPEPSEQPRSEYVNAKAQWLENAGDPYTFADFVVVKTGLRAATREEELRPDLHGWIRVMERFLREDGDPALVRRAKYEICVAALRGLHDLRPRAALFEQYMEAWKAWTNPAEIRDSSILMVYASAAIGVGEFEFNTQKLHQLSVAMVAYVEERIRATKEQPNRQAELIYTRSMLASLPFLQGPDCTFDVDGQIKWWFKLLSAADKAPLFCLEEFVDGLIGLTSLLSGHAEWDRLMRRADEVLEKRSSGFIIAEKCKDRAFQLIEDGKILAGIAQLHGARRRWFTGDTLRPSLFAMLTLSKAYCQLGLLWAAKYHAMGVAQIARLSDDDDLKPVFVSALHQLALCHYEAGEWVSFSDLLPVILIEHYEYVAEPDEWSHHEDLQISVNHFLIARALARAIGGVRAVEVMSAPIIETLALENVREVLLKSRQHLADLEAMPAEKVRATVVEQLRGVPFCDTGKDRIYRWPALGIQWSVSCENVCTTVAMVEQLVAILQIALADLATKDLCVLPTRVRIDARIGSQSRVSIEIRPGNDEAKYRVTIPESYGEPGTGLDEMQEDACNVALRVLTQCSCLPSKALSTILKNAFKDGLQSKIFIARPYSELYLAYADSVDFNERRHEWLGPKDRDAYDFAEPAELGWPETPGPGYTKAKASTAIRNRYEKAPRVIKHTLLRLRRDERFHAWVTGHRAEGRQDWWILLALMNVVINYRGHLEAGTADPDSFGKYLRRLNFEEDPNAPLFPVDELFGPSAEISIRSFLGSTASVWDLSLRGQTPDFDALDRLLGVRYRQNTDDVAHIDPFTRIEPTA